MADANTALTAARKTLGEKLVQKGILKDHVEEIVDRYAGGLTAASDGTVHVSLRGRPISSYVALDEALGYVASAAFQYAPADMKSDSSLSDEEFESLSEAKHQQIDYSL